MRRRAGIIGAVLVTLMVGGWASAGQPSCREPGEAGFLTSVAPAGGWFPYGGGLLHWWNPCCFPRCGAPDDYRRKTLPPVCWLPYPPYYIWGPPEVCCPQRTCPRAAVATPCPACAGARAPGRHMDAPAGPAPDGGHRP
jgi:hypothetical protein